MRSPVHTILPILLLVFAAAAVMRPDARSTEPRVFEVQAPPGGASDLGSQFLAQVVSGGITPMVHSVTAAVLPDGSLLAAWYGGTVEGHSDVRIFASRFDPELGVWSRERPLFEPVRTGLELGRGVRKLGNPVLTRHPNGSLWMFYVSVSVGGWSGSSINLSMSEDDGVSWSSAKRIVTSPLLNLGHLVRSPPVFFADGRVGLPIYHDMFNRFGELAIVSERGDLVDKHRMSPGPYSLQPAVIPFSETEAVSFFRSSGESPSYMLRAETVNAGLSWSEPVETEIPNRDAGFAVVRLSNGDLLTAYNNSHEGRVNLHLASSSDRGVNWREIVEIEGETASANGSPVRYGYPHLVQDSVGYIHLLYTWDRQQIRHARFSEAWLEDQGW